MRSLHKLSRKELSWMTATDLYARSLRKIFLKGFLARYLYKIFLGGLLARSLYEIRVQALQKRSLGKISATNLQEIPVQGLYKRSLGKLSVQAPYKRSLGKIFSPYKISKRGLCTRSLQEGSLAKSLGCKTSLSRSLRKISLIVRMGNTPQRERPDTPKVPRQNSHRARTPAIWHAQSAERVARSDMPKVPRRLHNLTGPKWREGWASNLKRERSDRLEVPGGSRKRSQEKIARASAKWALRHNESDLRGPKWREGCARGLRAAVPCETSVKNRRCSSFCAVIIIKNGAHVWDHHLEWTPSLNPYRKKPKCGHSLFGAKTFHPMQDLSLASQGATNPSQIIDNELLRNISLDNS